MADTERPQIYLITPPSFDLETFPAQLDRVLAAHEVACIRLALATKDEDAQGRAADACREVAHRHDVALVIENHIKLVDRHGAGWRASDRWRAHRALCAQGTGSGCDRGRRGVVPRAMTG